MHLVSPLCVCMCVWYLRVSALVRVPIQRPLCVCMCVWYLRVSAWVWVPIQRPEEDVKHLTPSISAVLTWEKACRWTGRSLCWPSWLISKLLGSASLCPLMLVIGACNVPDCLEEYWWRGSQTRILTRAQKMFLQSYGLISLASTLISSCCCFLGISPINQILFLMTAIFSIRYHHLSFRIWR